MATTMDRDDIPHPYRDANSGSFGGRPETLEALGWSSFFADQTRAEELSDTAPVRVVAVHRSGLQVIGVDIDEIIPPRADATGAAIRTPR